MTKFVNKISAIITSVVILVIGILCIVANSAEDASAFEGISLTLGITFIIVSSVAILLEVVLLCLAKGGLLLKAAVLSAGVLLALGIFFVANKTSAGTLLAMFLEFVPYVMIVVGSLLVLDALFTLIFGLVNKEGLKGVIIVFAIKLVIGALAILLGALALGNNWLGNNKFLIFGIILIVYAVYNVLVSLFAPKLAFVAIVKTDESKE